MDRGQRVVTGASRVSVVIPYFNDSARIGGAIRSALAQEPNPIEVIVVDDGSKDPVPEAMQDIDHRIRILRHESNRGGSAARNTGIKAARGDWIAFLDADDCWLPTKLAIQLAALQRAKAGKKLFAAANTRIESPTGRSRLYNSRPPHLGEDISRYILIGGCTFQTSTLVVDAETARQVQFDETLRRHQDWDFVLRLLAAGCDFAYCHEPLAIYWDAQDPNRVSKQKSIEPALTWMARAGHLMAADAAAAFYFRSVFGQLFFKRPHEALGRGFYHAFAGPDAFMWVARKTIQICNSPKKRKALFHVVTGCAPLL